MTDNECLQAIENKLDEIIKLLKKNYKTTEPANAPMLYDYFETWLNEVKAPTIKPKSLAVLRSGIEHYIKPLIADKPLNECRAAEMLNAIDKVPYSYMRQVVYSIFRAVFKRAYQYDLIAENPAQKLDFVKHTRQKGKALTNDEQTAFIKAIQDEPTRQLWRFYLLSGCRCNEALTLLWSDIDSENKRIFIRGTKTEYAERYIPLFPQLAELFAIIPHEGEKVFPYTLRQVTWHFTRIRHEHGFTFRIHDLRHTFATRCLESGIAINTVQKWLGHKSATTTADIYSHVQTEFERQEVTRFTLKI
jgi:integrase